MNLAQQTKGELTLGQRAMRKVLQHSRLICAYCGCPSRGVFSCGLITKSVVVRAAKNDGWQFIAGTPFCSATCERHYRLELVK